MPTFNQLIHNGRSVADKKSKAPALLKGWNSKKRTADRPGFPPEARCLHDCENPDPQEA